MFTPSSVSIINFEQGNAGLGISQFGIPKVSLLKVSLP